jgi:hypothetical protein
MSKDEDAAKKDTPQKEDADDRDARERDRDEPRGPLAKTSSGNADDITES